MKPITFCFWVLILTVGVILAPPGTQQQGQSMPNKSAGLYLASAAGAPARHGADRASGGGNKPASGIAVEVHPLAVPVTSMVKQQFTATVSGTATTAVSWYVDGVQGGNQTVGWIDANGLYSPPTNFVAGEHRINAVSQADSTQSDTAVVHLTSFTGIYTNKNDNSRDGLNSQETVLTPSNVNVNSFGKLFSFALDGKVQAQPLYVSNVNIPHPLHGSAGIYNVIYVATANDSVYAYDADGKVTGTLWKDSFIDPPSVVPVPGTCVAANVSIIGITPTPVIAPSTNTMYVEARTLEGQTTPCSGTYVHRLHALDITTGDEKFGGPIEIQASVPGTGDGSSKGTLAFDPQKENSRPGMLLSQASVDKNSVVYIATASNTDTLPYHGWLLGYDSQTLAQKYVYCTTPNGKAGGIWQMGGGLAADTDGNIYVQTGNGTFDSNGDFGSSVLKLTPESGGLKLVDSYTPSNYSTLNHQDWDVASGGLLLLPDQTGTNPHLMIGGGKEGTIYVINRDNLGGHHSTSDKIVQYIVGAIKASVKGGTDNGIWNTASYFNGNVYIFGQNDNPKMFTIKNGLLPTTATSTAKTVMRGPAAIISSNGTSNGIVWTLQYDLTTPTLWALNPDDLTQEYYDTNQDSKRDKVASRKISRVNPTVANGRVYVPANNSLVVYGLLQ